MGRGQTGGVAMICRCDLRDLIGWLNSKGFGIHKSVCVAIDGRGGKSKDWLTL